MESMGYIRMGWDGGMENGSRMGWGMKGMEEVIEHRSR